MLIKLHEEKLGIKLNNVLIPRDSDKPLLTFGDWFEHDQNMRSKIATNPDKTTSKDNTIERHWRTYRKWFSPSDLDTMPITEVDFDIIEDFLIECNDPPILKSEMDKIITTFNQTFARAKKIIPHSPMIYVAIDEIQANCLDTPDPGNREYTDEEMIKIYDKVRSLQTLNPSDSALYALELQLLSAPRRGEVPPLSWDDITGDNIVINKQLKYNEKKHEYKIDPKPKNNKTRYFPITPMIEELLERLKARNAQYYPDNPHLFPDPDSAFGIIPLRAAYNRHRSICRSLGISISKEFPKGTHAFRRTHETSLKNRGIDAEAIGRAYGNTPKTIDKNYDTKSKPDYLRPYISEIQNNLFNSKKSEQDNSLFEKENQQKETPESA